MPAKNASRRAARPRRTSVSSGSGGSGSLSVGSRDSTAESQALHYVNSHLSAGAVVSDSESLRVAGAQLLATDIAITTDTLTVASLQDESHSESHMRGQSIGLGYGISGAQGDAGKAAPVAADLGVASLSLSRERSDSHSDSRWVSEQTQILGGNSLTVRARDTTLTGAVLATVGLDANGQLVDSGKLELRTDTLVVNDLQDYRRDDTRGYSIGTTLSHNTLRDSEGQVELDSQGEARTYLGGSTTVSAQKFGHITEQATRATLGNGSVIVGGEQLSADNTAILGLAALNRDIEKSQEITRDQDTGGLNATLTIDHRLLDPDGWTAIWRDVTAVPENLKQIAGSTAGHTLMVTGAAVSLVDKGDLSGGTLTRNAGSMAEKNGQLTVDTLAIQDGEATNAVNNTGTLNAANDALREGLKSPDTQVMLVDNPTDTNGNVVAGQLNTTDQRTLVVNNNALDSVMNTLIHDNYHQSGGGETAARLIEGLGIAAFNVGNWTHSAALAQFTPTPQYIFAGLNDASAQQSLLDGNRLTYDAMKAAGDDFDNRQLTTREKVAIHNMAPAYAAQLYRIPIAESGDEQKKAAEQVLLFTAEQMVDQGTDNERPDDVSTENFILSSSVAGKPIGDTGQWMFVANDEQRADFFLNMTDDHPIRIAERDALIGYNQRVAEGEIIPGAYPSGDNPLVPQGGCAWGDGNCIRNFSEDIDGKIYTGQLYPCYVSDCAGNNYVNNPETNALLKARADKTMNDLLNTASLFSGVATIGYGLAARAAPTGLTITDNLINTFQVIIAGSQEGYSGAAKSLLTWGAAKSAASAGDAINLHPAVAPSLEFSTQQAIPNAIKVIETRNEN